MTKTTGARGYKGLKHIIGLMLSILAVAACDGSITGVTAAGTYNLRTINGQDVPFTLDRDTFHAIEVLSGYLTLNADGTYFARTAIRNVDLEKGTFVTRDRDATGRFRFSSGKLVLETGEGGDQRFTILKNGVLRWTAEGNSDGARPSVYIIGNDIWVYQK